MRPEQIPGHVKLVGLLATAVFVVALPRETVWPYAVLAVVLIIALARTGARARWVAVRFGLAAPFVVFALLLPFIATGERLALGPLDVSRDGLIAAWGILAKATLCVLAALALAASTSPEALVAGMRRLRLPDLFTQVVAFMLRYVHVVRQEWSRMMLAMASRGFVARTPAAWPQLARGLGVLFIRSYERGERVHLALLSRGYSGTMPEQDAPAPGLGPWVAGLWPAASALGVLVVAWGTA